MSLEVDLYLGVSHRAGKVQIGGSGGDLVTMSARAWTAIAVVLWQQRKWWGNEGSGAKGRGDGRRRKGSSGKGHNTGAYVRMGACGSVTLPALRATLLAGSIDSFTGPYAGTSCLHTRAQSYESINSV